MASSKQSIKLIDSLERFSDDNMRCCICLDDLREQRGFRELSCCNGSKMCEPCEYDYINVHKNMQSPCCRSKTPHLAKLYAFTLANSTKYTYTVSLDVNNLIRYIDPADAAQWAAIEAQRNAILDRCRVRRTNEIERLERERQEELRRQELERQERIARERAEREARERAEREARERAERLEARQRAERERREREERRQQELARQLSTVQHQIDSAGGMHGFVSQIRNEIPYLEFYKTVRKNAPARVPEAIASLEREIAKLSQVDVEQMTPAQQSTYAKLRKWHFVMCKNPVYNPELDRFWSTIWDNQTQIQLLANRPAVVFDRTIRPSALFTKKHSMVDIEFDCQSTFTFTIKLRRDIPAIQKRISDRIHTEMQTAGLYPIAMNIVTYVNAPVGLAANAMEYIAVSYCSPNPDRSAVIQLYEFSVIEPLFAGHAYDIEIVNHGGHNVLPCTDIMHVKSFQKLAVDYNVDQRQFKYTYVFS